MNTLFDLAGLAIVAYAEVASDGTSANINCGVTTTRTGAGVYNVILPANKTQNVNRDLIFVQPHGTGQMSATVGDSDPATKVVEMYKGATLADGDFDILILRTIITPPQGAPS
jgi:hypothetical protein